MNPSIVIPTYNEKENIRILIPQIIEVFEQNGFSTGGKIVVVDDNSPDGTSEVVEEFMKRYKNVFLLNRYVKTGLGSAYIAGFKYALELGADIIKTNYTGDPDSFKEVIIGCPVPVVVAGGPKMDTQHDLLEMVYDSIHSGGKGVAIGRNVFQADDPTALVAKISGIVHQGLTVDEV